MLQTEHVYEPAEKEAYVNPRQWSRDHWSTLAYVETAVVDEGGRLKNSKMRCHPRLHRELVGLGITGPVDGSDYPTRLRNGEELERHDDWSCLEDMAAYGLLDIFIKQVSFNPFGGCRARVELTAEGQRVAGLLRAFKGWGGNFANFSDHLEAINGEEEPEWWSEEDSEA